MTIDKSWFQRMAKLEDGRVVGNSQEWCDDCQMYHAYDYGNCKSKTWVAIVYHDCIIQAWRMPHTINTENLLPGERAVILKEEYEVN